MAFKKQGDVLSGYKLAIAPQISGQSKWAYAEKEGREVFIKQFLQPRFPQPGDPGGEALKAKRLREAKVFQARQELLDVVGSDAERSPALVTPISAGWIEGVYTKIFPKIDARPVAPKDVHALSAARRAEMMARIAQALQTLHRNGIVHSDVKWTNILFARRNDALTPFLIDYDGGFPLSLRPTDPEDLTYDAPYAAPEIWRFEASGSEADARRLGTQSDVFALGVLFHEFAAGCKPLRESKTPYGKHLLSAEPKLALSEKSLFSPLVRDMLAPGEEERPDLDAVVARLQAISEKSDALPARTIKTGESLRSTLGRTASSPRLYAEAPPTPPPEPPPQTLWGRFVAWMRKMLAPENDAAKPALVPAASGAPFGRGRSTIRAPEASMSLFKRSAALGEETAPSEAALKTSLPLSSGRPPEDAAASRIKTTLHLRGRP